MCDLIKEWLVERLGVMLDVQSETFLNIVRNGYLLSELLYSFGVITQEQLSSIKSSELSEEVLDKIQVWMRSIDIDFDDHTKQNILKGKLSSCIKLLYEMYLVLKTKNTQVFVAKNVTNESLRPVNERFQVVPIVEKIGDPSKVGPHPLSQPLSDFKHVIQWHKDRYETLMDKCKRAKEAYLEHINKYEQKPKFQKIKATSGFDDLQNVYSYRKSVDADTPSFTYEQLMEEQLKAQKLQAFQEDPKVARSIVNKIKRKNRKLAEDTALMTQMQNVIMINIWHDVLKETEKSLDEEISKKMVKQSIFEKQLATKLFEVREHKNVIVETRQEVDREIQKKRDEELVEQIFFNQTESADERYRYYFERDRAVELHRRIYIEKLRLKAHRKYDMCEQVMKDIIDMAMMYVEYKEAFDEEIPKRVANDLAALFVTEQPIFELVPETELILELEPENYDEEIFCEEIERQNAIDMINFEDYCNFFWPWQLEEDDPEYQFTINEIKAAMNILGHIVFRLLLTKYPKPTKPPPPKIPKVDVAVCINYLKDLTTIPALEKLLSSRNIKVLQMDEAVNHCVEAYKDEITVDYPESQFVEETVEAVVNANKKDKKKKKEAKPKGEKKNAKGKGKKKKDDSPIDSVIEIQQFQDKHEQTPKLFPCEEPVLSPKAELGRLAYEILNLGDTLNQKLLVKMFIEYLKSLTDIQGWVLINYPQNFDQVVLLEEGLTSREVPKNKQDQKFDEIKVVELEECDNQETEMQPKPIDDATTETSILDASSKTDEVFEDQAEIFCNDVTDLGDLQCRHLKQNHPIDDPNAEFRVSVVLTNPDPLLYEDVYDTYLTAYIDMIECPLEDDPKPYYVEENVELSEMEIFYRDQGCSYSLYYKTFDLATIKHLAKLIIGDYSVPPKSSLQLFGDTLMYLEADLNQSEAKPGNEPTSKSKGKKKEKKEPKKKAPPPDKNAGGDADKKDKKNKKDKKEDKKDKGKKKKLTIPDEVEVIISKEDKETQIPEVEPEVEEIFTAPPPEPKPGESNWKYVDLTIPDVFQIALATLWENVEEIYVNDFRELFFRKRLLWKAVMPYMTYVKKMMTDFIARPDDKQVHLFQFQSLYNEFDDDMRDDDEFKEELHCRVQEFKEKLWGICDDRMGEAEDQRIQVIQQDWVTKQLCELTNIYLTAMQLEIDRSGDSLQLLNDYYTSSITKMPCEANIIQKSLLEVITFTGEDDFNPSPQYSIYVESVLSNPTADFLDSPFHKILKVDYDSALGLTEQYKRTSLEVLAKMELYFLPKGKKGKKEKPAGKGKNKLDRTFPKFSDPEPEVLEAGLTLIEEWRRAITGEIIRVQLRLKLINNVALLDLQDVFSCGSKTFHGLFTDIADRYAREMNSVKEACEVLGRAVEEEVRLQPQLIFDGDRFYIDPNVVLFEEPLPEPEPPMKEYERPEVFTVEQLTDFINIVSVIAQNGIMPERAFVYLLQDMIVQDVEDGKPSMVPSLWLQLTPKLMNNLTFDFFGNVELIDWKDFIVNNLCIDFPTEEELMETRQQFRENDPDSTELVYLYQFKTIQFWFEKNFDTNEPTEMYRLNKIKEILCKIYSKNEDSINYTSLLLSFCKDANPILGVAKALQLSMGKFVCWQVDIGETFKESVRKRKEEEEQERLRLLREEQIKYETAEEVVDDLIDTTVHLCDSCYLEDYNPEEELHVFKDETNEEMIYLNNLMRASYENEGDEYNELNSDVRHGTEEDSMVSFLLNEDFSNVEIGFEEDKNPPKVYYLSFDVILNVLMASMPWHATVQNIDELSFREKLEGCYEACKNSEFDNMVLMHEFLNSEVFDELMKHNFKFGARNPIEIINKLLQDVL